MVRTVRVLCLLAILLWSVTSAAAATRTVCRSGCQYTDLQAAIDAAGYGDTILLRAGETLTGHYVLRAKSGTGTIVIRSDAPDSSLPGANVRLVPATRGGPTPLSALARIIGRGGAYKTTPLLRTDPGAHGYIVRFIDFDGVSHIGYETLIQIGSDTTSAAPYDITLDRVYVHGHRYKGQKRGIILNGERVNVLNSYISDIKAVNADSQAINGYNGAGPFRIENNYLEGAGENILFGGADPAVSNLVPSGIVIRRNHLYKPLSWRNAILTAPSGARAAAASGGALAAGTHYFRIVALMSTGTRVANSTPSTAVSAAVSSGGAATVTWSAVPGADRYRIYRGASATTQSVYLESTSTTFLYTGRSELSGAPPTTGTKWVVKNTFELKNAQDVTVEGNVFENCWAAGQYGYAIVLTPRNGGSAPWTRVRNVRFQHNIVRGVSGVANVLGFDDTNTSQRTEGVTFWNNLFHDVNPSVYGGLAKALLVGAGAANVVIERNTIIHTNSSVLYAYGAAVQGLVYRDNISQHHRYGIMGEGSSTGLPTLRTFFPGSVVQCNVLAGGSASLYPTPNGFPTVTQWNASFVNAAAGDYRLIPGSPVAVLGCSGRTPGADLVELKAVSAGTAGSTPMEPIEPVPAPANQPPVAEAGGPYAGAPGALVAVDGTASRDPDGSTLDYVWHWGDEVLVRAGDLATAALRGTEWTRSAQADAAGGVMVLNPDRGAAKREAALASPGSYVEFTVNVAAGVPYYLWMRLRATGNSYNNDSLYVQFSSAVDAAGAPLARIGSSGALSVVLEEGKGAGVSGWGWNDAAYGTTAAPIYFAQGGLQTIRIQQREDGVAWDQFVLSSAAKVAVPGLRKNDTTIIPEEFGTATGATAAHRYVRAGTYPLLLVVTDGAGASDSDAAVVTVR